MKKRTRGERLLLCNFQQVGADYLTAKDRSLLIDHEGWDLPVRYLGGMGGRESDWRGRDAVIERNAGKEGEFSREDDGL